MRGAICFGFAIVILFSLQGHSKNYHEAPNGLCLDDKKVPVDHFHTVLIQDVAPAIKYQDCSREGTESQGLLTVEHEDNVMIAENSAVSFLQNSVALYPRLVMRGGRLNGNTKAISALKDMHVKTVLNLEGVGTANDEKNQLVGFVDNFINVPMGATSAVTAESLQKIVEVFSNPQNYPIYVHCQRGIDRTGYAIAILRVLEGWSPDVAISEWIIHRDGLSHTLKTFNDTGEQRVRELAQHLYLLISNEAKYF